jgi:hypothetical protein
MDPGQQTPREIIAERDELRDRVKALEFETAYLRGWQEMALTIFTGRRPIAHPPLTAEELEHARLQPADRRTSGAEAATSS